MRYPYHESRTVFWGNWGIPLMDPQPDLPKNFGVIVGFLPFAVGAIGSDMRERLIAMCRAWVEAREIPNGFVPA